ncbi:MAG: gliding motility lipoprotein GldH [Flavobacteriales bacterium]
MTRIAVLCTILMGLSLVSCSDSMTTLDVEIYPEAHLVWQEPTVFDFDLETPHEVAEVYLNLQHNTDYPYRNIYFFTELIYPDASIKTDTLQYKLAQNDGKWLGSGYGASKTLLLSYPIELNQKGSYHLNIQQGMRVDTLIGIEKLALSLKRND